MHASYSIQAAAERTGLTVHVIRAWERRYKAIEPQRTAGQHRHYSEEDVERLALLHRVVQQGRSISKIARLPTEKLRTLVAPDPRNSRLREAADTDDPTTIDRREALAAVTRFDGPELEAALQRTLLARGCQALLRFVVAPLAKEIGDLWRAGELTVAHEHFFTASIRVFLGELTRQFAAPINAPRLIVTTPSGQLHEIGAVMAATTAASLGWRPLYLGPSLPAHEIAGAVLRNEASAVALSIIYPEDDPALPDELASLARLLPSGVRIMVGGRAAHLYSEKLQEIGALYAESMEEFGFQLDSLRRTAPFKIELRSQGQG